MPKKATAKQIRIKKSVRGKASGFNDQFIADSNGIFDVLLAYAIELHAKELHFEWQESRLKLRWRLGGKLAESFSFNAEQAALLRQQITEQFRLEASSKLPFQEKTITRAFQGRMYFLSLSVMSVIGGERFFLRLEKSEKYDLSRLDLNKIQRDCLAELFVPGGGIVIVGAVKAYDRQKQLKAIAGQFIKQQEKAVLISDQPIYDWSELEVLAIKPEIGFSRLVALRAALQADYDLILLDCLTRPQEMEIVLEMAQAGKQVLIGLPWSSPSKNFHFLWQLTDEKRIFRAYTKGMVTELSLPKLCTHCRTAHKLGQQGQAAIGQAFDDLPETVIKKLNLGKIAEQKFYQAKGCHFCQGSGSIGQVQLETAVKFKKPGREPLTKFNFYDLLGVKNFISLKQVAIIKASEGQVGLIEALSFMN